MSDMTGWVSVWGMSSGVETGQHEARCAERPCN